jgi:hypothetical protein
VPKEQMNQSINGQMNWTDNSQKNKYKWTINKWKKFNIFSHKEKANKNYIEILFHSSQKNYH